MVVPIFEGSRVTDSEELMGSSNLLSRLPQYLITAILEAHVAVATCWFVVRFAQKRTALEACKCIGEQSVAD